MKVDTLKILFISSEITPFAKSGGLADVTGSLPLALNRMGMDVRLFMPGYRSVREADFQRKPILNDVDIPLGKEYYKASLHQTSITDRVPVYLIHREDLYDRPNLYGSSEGDYYDNLERFTFFAHASLIFTRLLNFIPDIIHCHDWQAGLIPALLKGPYSEDRVFAKSSTVFTIHNMGYQGIFPAYKISLIGLPEKDFYHPEGIEYWGNISLLKSGIVYSDAVTTVSPTYAREIRSPEYGLGMEGILEKRRGSLFGVLNGVDYDQWSPEKDNHISHRYSRKDISIKKKCKKFLINEMGFDRALIDKPLLGMISRFDGQKGFDLLLKALDKILSMDVGLVILGSGNEEIQKAVTESTLRHKAKVRIHLGFDEPLAHQIMAGSDIFLIPSRYEPCGLTQMYALKYGTVPLVRATGGLNDSIIPFDIKSGKGNGFKFASYEKSALVNSIKEATDLFKDSRIWKQLMMNCMRCDFSWDKSAKKYVEIYRSIMKG